MDKEIEKLIKLATDNPKLEIVTMTDCEVVAEDWGYWKGEIINVEITTQWMHPENDRLYEGEDSIKEEMGELLVNDYKWPLTKEQEKEIDLKVEIQYKEIKEVIVIRISI